MIIRYQDSSCREINFDVLTVIYVIPDINTSALSTRTVILRYFLPVLGQNGRGQNGTDKMVRAKCHR